MFLSYRKWFLILGFLLLIPTLSWADVVGKFIKVEGGVDIFRFKQAEVGVAHVGDAVSIGDAIRTKRNGKAEIQFIDESVIVLAPETRITIDEYSFRQDGTRQASLLGLFRGKIRAIVSKIKEVAMTVSKTDSSFNIKTPTTIVGVKGTDFIVYYERGATGVIFLEGIGFVYNHQKPDHVVTIMARQATLVKGEDDVPLDAVSVSDAFIAPHLQDTTTNLTSIDNTSPGTAEVPNNGTDNKLNTADTPANANDGLLPIALQDVHVNVTSPNTTNAALTNLLMAGVGPTNYLGGGTIPQIINSIGDITAPPFAANTTIPITETYPRLLGTPVNVNITVP